ncbi:MAG: LacI family transcriptional regulator [Actinobacteria bacterium]|nr:LacI family transcriptional regulator [Actinomycetota bacterium]
MENKRITIKDIAKDTGLSIATVSRVINKINRHYSAETERKINDSIKKLHYTLDIIAYGLKKKKTYTIGFIVPELDSYYSEIFLGAQDAALKHGYANFLCNTNYNIELERIYINNLISRRVDGVVIATGLLNNRGLNRLMEAGIKVSQIESSIPVPEAGSGREVVSVVIDNYRYSKMAVKHLIDNGYKKIAFISAPPEEMSNLTERFKGYEDALRENGFNFSGSLVYFNKAIRGEWDLTSSSRMIEEIITGKNRPDALYIISDAVAMVAIQVCKKAGFKIPEDIGIVGFDDRRFCKYLDPPLTSIYQPKYEMGEKGMEMLIKLIEGEPVAEKTLYLDMKLSIRESSCRNRL